MKVLVADDSLVSRKLLEHSLRKWQFEVVMCEDGDSAWQVLETADAPRLAVLDWMMPGLDGVDIVKRLRSRSTDDYTYVLLLTAKDSQQDLLEGLSSGADDYLTKPYHEEELHMRLRTGQRILDLQQRLLATQEQLRIQAAHDGLTGLLNRTAGTGVLQRELARSRRENQPLAAVLADLDFFKGVNDTYGHQAGDDVLKETARRLVNALRAYDTVCRYGGEEFLLILPGIGADDALSLAERTRRAINAEPMVTNNVEIFSTISMGVAWCPPTCLISEETILEHADNALYKAKRNGRNRVELTRL